MRYRTAAIVSGVLIALTGGMFGLVAAVKAFLPSLEQGRAISGYEGILLGVAFFCARFKWFFALLVLPAVVVLFTVAVFTGDSRAGETARPTPPPTGRPPALWNPKAAAYWSLLFSPAFGAFLHARNADAMGRVDEAKANRMWFYVLIAYFGLAFVTIFIPIPQGLFTLASIGLLFGWYLASGRSR